MQVDLLDHMGTDLDVVNAARVSFDKFSELIHDEEGRESLANRDIKLIRYLATKGHFTPFTHIMVKIRVTAPIFVARQLFKHTVGLSSNEVSRRYVDSDPEFFMPDKWRLSAENVKQGSSWDTIGWLVHTDGCLNEYPSILHEIIAEEAEDLGDCEQCNDHTTRYTHTVDSIAQHVYDTAEAAYKLLIENDVCAEQARMLLPQAMYTQWIWTGSVQAFARVCNLRLDPHAQKETALIAKKISDIMEVLYPVSWEALRKQ